MLTMSERLRGIADEARGVRESLTLMDRDGNYGPERGERRVGAGRRGATAAYHGRVAECAMLLADVYAGRRPIWHLQEAMTTSDFPNLFGDVLYRQLLGYYMPYPVSYPQWTRAATVNDFRTLHLYAIDGGQGALKDPIKERAPYPEIKFTETPYGLTVAKYGRRYGITFEMVTNDDLNAFQQRPMMMASGARRGEEFLATGLAFDSAGPHASMFTSGNKNIVTSNPALSVAGLQTAFAILAAQVDADSEPIVVNAVTLVAPPALQITAENILNSVQIRLAESGGTSNQLMYVNNWMKSRVTLAVDPYIPIIVTTGTRGNTSWMLVADPNDLNQRPAFIFGKLRGYEQPQLFVKDPDSTLVGGGSVDALNGDFDTDSIDYKIRHFFGGVRVDPKMAVASNGTGS